MSDGLKALWILKENQNDKKSQLEAYLKQCINEVLRKYANLGE